MSDGFRIASAYVKIDASDDGFRAAVEAKIKAATDGVAAKVRLDPNAEGLAEKIRAEADAANAEAHVRVKVDEDGGGLSSLEADAQRLRATFDDLESSSRRAGSALDDVGNRGGSAGSKAGAASGGFRLAAVGMGAMVTAGVALVPALAAIPGLAAGAAAGVGALAGAVLGVAKAFKDYGAEQTASGGGISGAQQAATAYSNAVAIRGAEQAITDARTQAARGAVTSAEQIQNAQHGVQDAERNAAAAAQNSADQITAAQQRVAQAAYAGIQAEQAYTNAVYNEQQAQQALVNARQAAANQLVDSQNAAKDAHLSVEQAVLNEDQAQRALDAANGNSLLTADQRAQAQLALEQATQQVADAKQHEKEATEAANVATSNGVDNAPSVLAAQHALELATLATANAQHGVQQAAQNSADAQQALARANQAAANQQITSDEQVAKSKQQLADAERNAAQQREDAAKQIARAEQNLTDTIKQQQLAATAAASSGSAAVNQFAKDMQNLSPAGRDFVNQLISMKGEFHQLALDAQTATLPGFTQMLKDSNHLMPTVEDGISRTGHALSDMAAAAGHLFANPDFDRAALQFEQIITGGFGEFTSALPPLLNAIVVDGDKAAPLINAVALGVHDLVGSGLPAFLSGLTVDAGGAAQGVGALFHAVDGLLGPVGTLAGAASGALGPALADLEPGLITLVDDIEAGLLPLMPELSTDLVDVAQILDQLFQIAEPIIPVLSNGIGGALRIVDPLLKDTADFLRENQAWLTPVAEGALAVYAAVKLWQGVMGLGRSGVKLVTDMLGKFSSAAETAAGKAGSVANALGGTQGLATKLGTVGLVAGEAFTAIYGIGETLNHMIYDSKDATSSVDQFSEALLNSESKADNATAKLDDYARGARGLASQLPGVTDAMAQTGLGMIRMADATGVGATDLKNFDQSLADMVSNGNASRAKAIVDQIAQATDAHGQKLADVNKSLPTYEAAVEKAGVDSQATARATQNNADATQNLGAATQNATDKFQYMTSTMSQSQALDQFRSQLLGLKDTIDQNGASLDTNTAKGLQNRDAFSQIAREIENYGQQLSDAGTNDGVVALKMQDMISQLEDQAGKFGYNKQQIDAYLKSIGLIPSSVKTTLTTDIAVQVNQTLLEAAAQNIGHVVGHYLVPGQAAGGWVVGPGTSTSDSVLRRLSNGEFVVPADAAAQIGPQGMEQIRNGQIPQVGGTTPQASAPVINLNYYGSALPSIEEQQVIMRDLTLAVRS